MNIMDGSYQLLEILAGNFFLESLIRNYEIKQLTPLGKLHNQVKVFLCFYNLIELNNIGVVHLLKNLYLPWYSFNVFFIFNLTLL